MNEFIVDPHAEGTVVTSSSNTTSNKKTGKVFDPITGKRKTPNLHAIQLPEHLPYLLGQVYRLRQRQLETIFKSENLSESEYRILVVLGDRDGCSVSEMADSTVIDRTTLSRMLAAMEARGLIERNQAKSDRRITNIFITQEGMKMFRRIMPVAQHVLSQLTQDIAEEDVRHVKDILRKMIKNLS